MFHFIYKTTNLIDGKFYYGVHSAKVLKDSYLGSGTILKNAIKKYGKENFKREIIVLFSERNEALYYEKTLLTYALLKDDTCYNISPGGQSPPKITKLPKANKLLGNERTEKQKIAAKTHAETMKKKYASGKMKPWRITGKDTGNWNTNTKTIIIDGIQYSSLTEASKAMNFSIAYFSKLRKKYKTNTFVSSEKGILPNS